MFPRSTYLALNLLFVTKKSMNERMCEWINECMHDSRWMRSCLRTLTFAVPHSHPRLPWFSPKLSHSVFPPLFSWVLQLKRHRSLTTLCKQQPPPPTVTSISSPCSVFLAGFTATWLLTYMLVYSSRVPCENVLYSTWAGPFSVLPTAASPVMGAPLASADEWTCPLNMVAEIQFLPTLPLVISWETQ